MGTFASSEDMGVNTAIWGISPGSALLVYLSLDTVIRLSGVNLKTIFRDILIINWKFQSVTPENI